jgi:hypothetical protein
LDVGVQTTALPAHTDAGGLKLHFGLVEVNAEFDDG